MFKHRQFKRVLTPGTVEVKLYAVGGHEELNGLVLNTKAEDVSEGGIRLSLDRELPVGTQLKLRITIPDPPSTFVHRAELRWCNASHEEPGVFYAGIEFNQASQTHEEEWKRLLYVIAHLGSTRGVRFNKM